MRYSLWRVDKGDKLIATVRLGPLCEIYNLDPLIVQTAVRKDGVYYIPAGPLHPRAYRVEEANHG